jgi:Asp-tRNA(Asn)/Glu-tRNA(Gln) amidotransferase A subunit family amidase
MKDRIPVLPRILLSLVAGTCLQSCALPLGPKESATPDHAFISYWPPKSDSRQLRLAIKDIIDLKGDITTAGSQYLAKNSPPAKRDAKLLGPARGAGVQIVGKTNLTEFALGVTGANEFYGTPRNPVDRHRVPGGSSSGSAVAVANDEADVAFGSDTAGSIRVPAACCGILGLKTTFGLVPLKGVFPVSPKHLDTVGPMAKDVGNIASGMALLDPEFSARYEAAKAKNPSAGGIRIGRLYIPGTDPKIDRAIDRALIAAGFQLVRLNDRFLAAWDQAQANGTVIAEADGWLSDRQYLGKLGVGLTTQATIRLGELQYSTSYKRALAEQKGWQRELRRTFKKVDFIGVPTLKKLPPHTLIFERSALFEARLLSLQNTVAVNYAGNPAIAIPVQYQKRGFPVTSVQLIGPLLSEGDLVNAARFVTAKEGAR